MIEQTAIIQQYPKLEATNRGEPPHAKQYTLTMTTRQNLYQPNNTLMKCTLTKTCLMKLPTGAHLVSNSHRAFGMPVFAERVSPLPKRKEQWRRVVAARANGRHFLLFSKADGYEKFLKNMGHAQKLEAVND